MEIVIDGERRLSLKSQFAEYWEYRGLLRHLVIKELKVRYRQTAIGIAWSLAQPLLPALILGFVFSGVLTHPEAAGVPYALFLLAGLVPWSFFSSAVTTASGAFVSNGYILTKVYFPRVLLPAALVAIALLEFSGSFLILCGWAVLDGWHIHVSWLWLPLLCVWDALLAFSIAIGIASLNVLYRDVRHALPFLMQVWLFATPILYSPQLVPQRWRWVFGLNPMAGIVLGFRHALFGIPFPAGLALATGGTGILAALGGIAVFLRLQDILAEKV